MIFGHFLLEVNEANAFVVGCEETREAILVDAGDWDARIEAFLREHALRLTQIFITHDHYDHTGGLAQAVAATGAAVLGGPGKESRHDRQHLAHGDAVTIGAIAGRAVTTPGHTPEGMSLVLPRMVFTGDALFAGSVGGTTSPANAEQQMTAIRQHLFTLPDSTEIHPGHGPSSAIGIERQYNPFFNP